MLKLRNVSKNKVKIDRYQSIKEMPVYYWYECIGERFECVRVGVRNGGEGTNKDKEAFKKIFDEYIDKYGWGSKEKEIKAMVACIKHNAKWSETKDDFILNAVRIHRQSIEGDDSDVDYVHDLDRDIVILKKIHGIQIDKFTTTVAEYEAIKRLEHE